MRISPISYSYNNSYSASKKQNTNSAPSFTSLFADATPSNEGRYAYYTINNPLFAKLKNSSTRIFRELPSQIAISKLLNPDEKSEIKVLGCSDGSEAWAYGIVLKEEMGDKASQNVKIKGVDISPQMIEIAKTGRITCSDVERKYASGKGEKTGNESPVKGDKWDNYLIKSTRPEGFTRALENHPFLKYVEYDPAANKSIGNGIEWYEINQDGLPETTFEQGDMLKHLDPDDEAQNEVYVVANSAAYLIQNKGEEAYIKLFQDIKEKNEGKNKNVYVVVGDVENRVLSPVAIKQMGIPAKMQNGIRRSIKELGFEKISDTKLRKKGVANYKDAASKIYVLKNE